MSDENLQARLESEARGLPVLTGPEKRGFRVEDSMANTPPPEVPAPDVPGLDFSKPESGANCAACGRPLPADAVPRIVDGESYLCCRKCPTSTTAP